MSTETASGRAGTFMFDRDAEAMPRRALAALQASRLKDTLERAYALAHYRQKFDAAGVRPGDFKSLADIGRFPFTLKSDLRECRAKGCSGCTRRRGRRASPRSSAIPRAISTRGRT